MKNVQKLNKDKIEQMDQLLYKFEQEIESLQQLRKKLNSIHKKADILADYLQNDWMEDYEQFSQAKGWHVLVQDYLYNALSAFSDEKREILKWIAKHY